VNRSQKKKIWLKGCTPHHRVFFVRVGNKGVRLDAASSLADEGFGWMEEEICGFSEDNMKECSTKLARE
jgi:hypothetical protein